MSLFRSELYCQRYSDEAPAEIKFEFIVFVQPINQNYPKRLELEHGLDLTFAVAKRLGEVLSDQKLLSTLG